MDNRIVSMLIDSFPKMFVLGVKVTIPLAIFSFALAFIIAVIVAFIQYANVKFFKQLTRFYIWIVRGTPLLVQLYIFFYGLPKIGIKLAAIPCAILVLGLN